MTHEPATEGVSSRYADLETWPPERLPLLWPAARRRWSERRRAPRTIPKRGRGTCARLLSGRLTSWSGWAVSGSTSYTIACVAAARAAGALTQADRRVKLAMGAEAQAPLNRCGGDLRQTERALRGES